MFNVFPDNLVDGVKNLSASLVSAAESGRQHAMSVQRYDIRDLDGRFVVRTGGGATRGPRSLL
jgi:hypothetical protein